MTTGQIIRQRRKELKVPVEEIAKVLNVSVATIYRYESGDIEKVPGSALDPLARILQTTPATLMGWETDNHFDHTPVSVFLTQHESKVIASYRGKPLIQPAVDKLLDVEPQHEKAPSENNDFLKLLNQNSRENVIKVADGNPPTFLKHDDENNEEDK